jgi:hypothetical protein
VKPNKHTQRPDKTKQKRALSLSLSLIIRARQHKPNFLCARSHSYFALEQAAAMSGLSLLLTPFAAGEEKKSRAPITPKQRERAAYLLGANDRHHTLFRTTLIRESADEHPYRRGMRSRDDGFHFSARLSAALKKQTDGFCAVVRNTENGANGPLFPSLTFSFSTF